jgi:hypothetical protein
MKREPAARSDAMKLVSLRVREWVVVVVAVFVVLGLLGALQ